MTSKELREKWEDYAKTVSADFISSGFGAHEEVIEFFLDARKSELGETSKEICQMIDKEYYGDCLDGFQEGLQEKIVSIIKDHMK